MQEQLAKTSTKGNRESIQRETTTREVMSWTIIFLDVPIGENIKKLCIFSQATFALVAPPAKWSVSQPLDNLDVGSSKPFCRPTFTL